MTVRSRAPWATGGRRGETGGGLRPGHRKGPGIEAPPPASPAAGLLWRPRPPRGGGGGRPWPPRGGRGSGGGRGVAARRRRRSFCKALLVLLSFLARARVRGWQRPVAWPPCLYWRMRCRGVWASRGCRSSGERPGRRASRGGDPDLVATDGRGRASLPSETWPAQEARVTANPNPNSNPNANPKANPKANPDHGSGLGLGFAGRAGPRARPARPSATLRT